MKNKFRIGEIVIIKGKNETCKKSHEKIGIVKLKDYEFNQYLITILSSNKEDWFSEEEIGIIMERKIKKKDKYKVALAINKEGLEYICNKIDKMPNKYNNVLDKVDFYKEYNAFKKTYAILIWTSTYWSMNNFAVKCIHSSFKELKKQNIAYKQIIIGETNPTHVEINEFIDNDTNVDIFNIFHKVELKNVGGILV